MPNPATDWVYNDTYSNILDTFAALIEHNQNYEQCEHYIKRII